MTAAEAIVTRLKAIVAVTTLVGQRIYTDELPQGFTPPAIRVQRISETELMHLRGGVALYRTRVQVDSVSRKASGVDHYAQARNVDEAVRGAGDGTGLIGYSGTVGTSPALVIKGILADGVREGYEGDEIKEKRFMRDVIVWHRG